MAEDLDPILLLLIATMVEQRQTQSLNKSQTTLYKITYQVNDKGKEETSPLATEQVGEDNGQCRRCCKRDQTLNKKS